MSHGTRRVRAGGAHSGRVSGHRRTHTLARVPLVRASERRWLTAHSQLAHPLGLAAAALVGLLLVIVSGGSCSGNIGSLTGCSSQVRGHVPGGGNDCGAASCDGSGERSDDDLPVRALATAALPTLNSHPSCVSLRVRQVPHRGERRVVHRLDARLRNRGRSGVR